MKYLFRFIPLVLLLVGASQAHAQKSRWITEDDNMKLSIERDGEVSFNETDDGIATMSRGAELRIRKEEGRLDQRLTVKKNGSEIEYDYRRNGKRLTFAEARSEIGELIRYFIRESGMDADRRVARLLKSGGTDAVFREVALISSGGSSARYLLELAKQAALDDQDLRRWAKAAEQEVHSGGDRARVLMEAADQFVESIQAFPSWAEAVASVPSSGDRSRALLYVLQRDPGPTAKTRILEVTRTIPSAGDKARVLVAASTRPMTEAMVQKAFFEAASSISSSGDRARVLLSALGSELGEEGMVSLLKATRGISSGGDKARVLVAASERVRGHAMEEAYLDAAESISSSGDKNRALRALMRNG